MNSSNKIFQFWITGFLTATIFLSCKKIINIDLENASPEIVIEGNVTNTSFAEVRISKSVPFSSPNIFPDVSDADVSITDNNGTKYKLSEVQRGLYTNFNLTGVPGRTYNLYINAEGKVYTSISTMPLQVNLDTILLDKIFFGDKSIWVAKPQYKDPDGFGNSYKFTESINGVRYPQTWVWDDRLTNNGISTIPLIQNDSIIKKNDVVGVEMQCIDKNIFRYFTAFNNIQYSATTPANPPSNITGGALGYFSAHTTQYKEVIVTQ